MGALAASLADLSVTPERQVGCVVFDHPVQRVWSFGYNGPATGMPHDTPREPPYVQCPNPKCLDGVDDDENPCQVCEDSDRPGYIRNPKPSGMQHAEVNTLIRAPVMDMPPLGAVCWLTLAPCTPCALHIIQSGVIGIVIFDTEHDKYDAELLPSRGIAAVGGDTIRQIADGGGDTAKRTRLQTLVESLYRKVK